MSSSTRRDAAVLLLVCVIAFGWRLGRLGLIDPDEPFYAQTAAEMLDRHDWLTPHIFGHPQFEKPPLFYWLSCVSFLALGRGELAARLPGALASTVLVFLTWGFGRRAFGRRAGLLAGLVLATGVAFAVTARMMLTDAVFAACVCASCFAFWRAAEPATDGAPERPRTGWVVLSLAMSAVAVLTKGPLGFLIPGLAAFAWLKLTRRPFPARGTGLALGLALFALIALPWYVAMIADYRGEYVRAFFVHENLERLVRAEHPANNRLDYYPAVLILGSFPWIPLLGVTLMRVRRLLAGGGAAIYLACWFATSFVFFTIAQSKLPTYILFLFVPLAVLAGVTLDALLQHGFAGHAERRVALVLAALQALGVCAVFAFPAYRAFFVPAAVAAGCLGLAALLLVRRPSAVWIAASAAATLALVIGATTWSAAAIEAETSVRPAARLLAQRGESEAPVLASAFLVRGVYFYTHRGARVLSNRGQPFFTPHPLPLVRGAAGLEDFVREHGATFCVMRAKEWREIEKFGTGGIPATGEAVGDKLVLRVPPATTN
jgi:4-amino-4-deoxy-L-arabinose transferase-like glycosyltransferase